MCDGKDRVFSQQKKVENKDETPFWKWGHHPAIPDMVPQHAHTSV